MKKFFLLTSFFLSFLPLWGDCFYWEGGARAGYRQDRNSYRIFTDLPEHIPAFRESWNRVRIFQTEAFTKFRFWSVEFAGDADYGWILSGDVKSWPTVSQESEEEIVVVPVKFFSNARGEVWDAFGSAGIRFSFCCTKWSAYAVKPLGGYSYHHQSYKRRCVEPSFQSVDLPNFNSVFVSMNESNRLKQCFYGPFVGAEAYLQNKGFKTNFGYSYHWLDFEQKFGIESIIHLSFGEPLVLEQDTIFQTAKFKSKKTEGHRAWLGFSFLFDCCWRIGARGTYFYAKTCRNNGIFNATTTTLIQNMLDPPTTTITSSPAMENLKWQSFTAVLEVAYEF